MSEKSLKNPANMEKVDECMKNIPSCLTNLNDKTKSQAILNNIILKIDAYVEVNQNKDKYNIKINGYELNISLDINQLEQIGPILIELFNTDIQLFGSLYGRSIAKDSLIPNGLEKKYIDSKNYNLSKDDVEELFVFIMKVKGIPMEDWEIEPTICANGKVNNACKQALGNKKGS